MKNLHFLFFHDSFSFSFKKKIFFSADKVSWRIKEWEKVKRKKKGKMNFIFTPNAHNKYTHTQTHISFSFYLALKDRVCKLFAFDNFLTRIKWKNRIQTTTATTKNLSIHKITKKTFTHTIYIFSLLFLSNFFFSSFFFIQSHPHTHTYKENGWKRKKKFRMLY